MRDDEEIRRARFARVRAASDADLNALTILRARGYLARYPDHGYAWRVLGETLRALVRYDEAEEALANALRLCPEERKWIPMSDLGHLEKQRGKLERAAAWYRRAIEADPRHAAGYIFLGGILRLQGRLLEAEEVHRTATETCYEGDIDEAFLNLGLILLRRGAVRRGGRMLPRGHPHGPRLPPRPQGPPRRRALHPDAEAPRSASPSRRDGG